MGWQRRTIGSLQLNYELDYEVAQKVTMQLDKLRHQGDLLEDAITDLVRSSSTRPFSWFEMALNDVIKDIEAVRDSVREAVGAGEP